MVIKMKKALVSPAESAQGGYRICQIEDEIFDVAHPLFWVDCSDAVDPAFAYFDAATGVIAQTSGQPQQIGPVTTPVRSVTPLQFLERFNDAEQLTIVTATMSSPVIKLWYDKLMAATEVVLSDPRLPLGLDALVSAGLITTARRAVILTTSEASSGIQVA